jgi:hypothetical protein
MNTDTWHELIQMFERDPAPFWWLTGFVFSSWLAIGGFWFWFRGWIDNGEIRALNERLLFAEDRFKDANEKLKSSDQMYEKGDFAAARNEAKEASDVIQQTMDNMLTVHGKNFVYNMGVMPDRDQPRPKS